MTDSFKKGVKESVDVKLEQPLNREGGLRHNLSPTYNVVLSPYYLQEDGDEVMYLFVAL